MQLFTNNADSVLNGAIDTTTTSITVKAGEGAKFPSPTGGDYFLVTLFQKVGAAEVNHEIVKCTSRAADVLTVVRAQEGTTSKSFGNADPIELRATAGVLGNHEAHANNTNNPHSVTKAQVGLGSVDNTADASKPVSTAQQTALNLKANLASPAFTGTVTGITAAMVGATTSTDITNERSATATLTNKTITETVYALSGTTPAITATNGAVQTWTLSGASTPTSSLTTGQSCILQITSGAYSITWPSVVWTKVGGSGAAPTLFSAGKTTVVLWKVGSVLYGSHLGDTV